MRRPATDGWIETYRGTVYPRHLDHMGHMNVAHYVEKFDEGVWHLFAAVGLTPSYMRNEHRGMAAVEMTIRYLRELHAGDLVTVRSGVLDVTEQSLHVVQEMHNGETGQLAAVEKAVAVHMDTRARRAVPFPEAIAARARDLIVQHAEV